MHLTTGIFGVTYYHEEDFQNPETILEETQINIIPIILSREFPGLFCI